MKIVKKKRGREQEVDVDKLFDEREKQARRETKKYKDMNSFSDWARLMIEKPGFYRD